MKNKKLKVLFGATGVVLLCIGAFLAYKSLLRDKTAGVSIENWDRIKMAHKTTVNTHLSSPTGRAWLNKDFKTLESSFGAEKEARENENFFRASIYVLDVGNIVWSEQDKEPLLLLTQKIANYISAPKKNVAGAEVKAISYAGTVLYKIGINEKVIETLLSSYGSLKDGNHRNSLEEVLIGANPLPAAMKKSLAKKLSKVEDLNEGLRLLLRSKDTQFIETTFNRLYQEYPNYSDKMKVALLKNLTIHRQYIKGDLKPYLMEASKKKGSQWNDAFLGAVRSSGYIDDFYNEIKAIEAGASDEYIRQMASTVLNEARISGSKGGQ